MALTRTTLSAAIKANDILIPVVNTGAGFPGVGVIVLPQQPMYIEDELMFIVQVPSPGLVLVRTRGADGTQAVAHDIGSSCVTSATPVQDFPNPFAPGTSTQRQVDAPDVLSYGASGPMVVPIEPISMVIFNGATPQAMTLGPPSLGLNGIVLKISSATNQAHTITGLTATGNTALFNNAAAGSPFTVITFPAQPGAAIELEAVNGLWNVNNVQGAFTYA